MKQRNCTHPSTTSLTDTIHSAPLTNPVPVLCHLDAKPAKLMSHQSRPCVNSSQCICQPDALCMPTSCYIGGNSQTTICQRRTSAWPSTQIPQRWAPGDTVWKWKRSKVTSELGFKDKSVVLVLLQWMQLAAKSCSQTPLKL